MSMATGVEQHTVSEDAYMRVQDQLIDLLGQRNTYRHHGQVLQARLDMAHRIYHRLQIDAPELHDLLVAPQDCQ